MTDDDQQPQQQHYHFTDPASVVGIFEYSLTLLRTQDGALEPARTVERERAGLHGGNELADLNAVSWLCGLVKTVTRAARNVEDVLLANLVETTEALLVTAIAPVEDDLVMPWLKARSELAANRLAGCVPQVKTPEGNDSMTPEQRRQTEMLRTQMNAIHQQPDSGLMPAFLEAIDATCDQVVTLTLDTELPRDSQARAWIRAAVATKAILRDHSEDTKAEWIAAYADLPVMG